MLPHQSRNPVEDNTVEGRLSNISSAGYLAIARSNAELGAVLDKVKVGGWVVWGGRVHMLLLSRLTKMCVCVEVRGASLLLQRIG